MRQLLLLRNSQSNKSHDQVITLLTKIKTGIEGEVEIRRRKVMGELSRDVPSELGFDGCIGV